MTNTLCLQDPLSLLIQMDYLPINTLPVITHKSIHSDNLKYCYNYYYRIPMLMIRILLQLHTTVVNIKLPIITTTSTCSSCTNADRCCYSGINRYNILNELTSTRL